jgi:hypothetical protein
MFIAGKPCGERRDPFAKKTKRTADVIATVSAAFNDNRRIIIRQLALGCGFVGCPVGPLAIFFILN